MKSHQRRAQREREADQIANFYNDGPGAILGADANDTTAVDGEAAEEWAKLDSSATDAAAAETALATVQIRFPTTDEHFARLKDEASRVTFTTPEGYEAGRKILATLRALSGAIERTRKVVKAPALAWGKRVDDTAKGLMGQLEEIREPLQALKDNEDEERAKRRRAAEEAEREALRVAEEAKLAQQRAELEAQRQEQARVAEEQRQAREAAEASATEARRQLDAERAAFEAERAQFAAANAPAPVATAAPVTQEAVDEALADDLAARSLPPVSGDWVSAPTVASETEALRAFAQQIRALKSPTVKSDVAAAIVEQVEYLLAEAAQALESFEEAATAAE